MSAVVFASGASKRQWPRGIFIGTAFMAMLTLFALVHPLIGIDPNHIHPDYPTVPPGTAGFWLGTDDLGRDVLSRLAIGARISLLIGLATALVSVVFGTLYGIIAALAGGRLDNAMMRLADIIYSLPGLMIVILFSVFLGRNVTSLVLALSLFSWPNAARMIRAQVLSLRQEEFVEAFHSLGGLRFRFVCRHLIPNLWGLIILATTITVPRAILTESTLSFIGLGVEPPLSSWGTMASEGWQLVRVAPHMLIFPAVMIISAMVALNLIGNGLSAVLDPKSGLKQ